MLSFLCIVLAALLAGFGVSKGSYKEIKSDGFVPLVTILCCLIGKANCVHNSNDMINIKNVP